MDINDVLKILWKDYSELNPSVTRIHKLFESQEENVKNDHIAFRTYDDKRINGEVLAKLFLSLGYEERGKYFFKEKSLNAKHYEHRELRNAPKIFISELITSNFSDFLQQTVKSCVDAIPEDLLYSNELFFAGNVWGKPDYNIYTKLRDESEYAAWLYVYGFRANHFTVNVNALRKYNSLEKVNEFLKNNGFKLNTSGGEIKGTPKQLLEQSSTMADIIEVEFKDGKHQIPACYYEFARRYPDERDQLFTGFIAQSADKIFESTDYYRRD